MTSSEPEHASLESSEEDALGVHIASMSETL